MRKLLLGLTPLLLLACERDAAAPVGLAPNPAVARGATVEWTTERIPVADDPAGTFPCLGNAQGLGYGAWTGTYHWVTLPDGRTNVNWSATWEAGSYILINGQSWVFADPFPERGFARFDKDGNLLVEHGNIATSNWRNSVTGAVLHIPMHWYITYDASGVILRHRWVEGCRVTQG